MKLEHRFQLNYALNTASVGLFAPVVALYCHEQGMNLSEISWFFAAYFAAFLALELPSGVLADKYGRLVLFKWSKGLDCLNLLLLMACSDLILLLLASFLGGVARALGSGSTEAWFVDQLAGSGKGSEISWRVKAAHFWGLISMAVSAILGAMMVDLSTAILPSWNKFDFLLLCGLCLHLFLMVTVKVFFAEGEDNIRKDDQTVKLHTFAFYFVKNCPGQVKILMGMQLCYGLIFSLTQTYWQPALEGLVNTDSKFIFGVSASVTLLLSAGITYLLNRKQVTINSCFDIKIVCLFLISGGLMALLGRTSDWQGFVLIYLLLGGALFSLRPLLAVLLHEYVDNQYRATALSLASLAFNTGGVCVGFVAGELTKSLSIQQLWLGSGSGVVLMVSVLCLHRAGYTHWKVSQHKR